MKRRWILTVAILLTTLLSATAYRFIPLDLTSLVQYLNNTIRKIDSPASLSNLPNPSDNSLPSTHPLDGIQTKPISVMPNLDQQSQDQKNPSGNISKTTPNKLSTLQLWHSIKLLLMKADFQQFPILSAFLADKLRKRPDLNVYQGIADLLYLPDTPVETKALLLDLLSNIATPEALQQLLNFIEQNVTTSEYVLALQAISRIGDNRWNGKFHVELSPPLEKAWATSPLTDQAFFNAIGTAIAKIGSPNGVNSLLLTLSGGVANTPTENAKEETSRIKQQAAFNAIKQVRNSAAIDVLGHWLEQETLDTPTFEVSGFNLAKIGSTKATEKIVKWAEHAPAEGARHLKYWLSIIADNGSLAPLTTSAVNFKSSEIEAVFNQSLPSADPAATTTPIILKNKVTGNLLGSK